jgi:hypothetical protein
MSEQLRRSWFQRHIENALVRGLSRAYETVTSHAEPCGASRTERSRVDLARVSKAGIRVQISKITGMTSGRFCVCLEM